MIRIASANRRAVFVDQNESLWGMHLCDSRTHRSATYGNCSGIIEMKLTRSKFALLAVLVICVGIVQAQTEPSTLSGEVKSVAGQAISSAKVLVKNEATGEAHSAQTDSAGRYAITGLAPGDYTVSISAPSYSTSNQRVTLAAGVSQTLNANLASELSLGSLGFPAQQTKGNAREQALLNKRSHMLQVHQKLGLITAIPFTATLIASTQAAGRNSSATGRDVHIALGSATVGLYAATASYAIFAPKIPGEKAKGPTRFHKTMAFIHGPGMVATPILGAMAESQRNQGQRVHGAASYHGAVAVVTAAAFGLALLSETKPSWIPGLGHKMASLFAPDRSKSEPTDVAAIESLPTGPVKAP
jgi:Carboxypeptidase regulatory-like domain